MRMHVEPLIFATENRDMFHIQYPAIMGILGQVVRAVYDKGVETAPRVRGLPYNPTSSGIIAEKFWADIRARRFFVCSAESMSLETPVETTPTTAVGKKNPDRTVRTDRRVIADMRRIDVGFAVSRYYPARVPPIESIARLLVSMTVTLPGFDIEMPKRVIASAFRLLRLRPASSLLMCTELPGGVVGHSRDVIIFYFVMPFGRNGSPANFAIFGDAISCLRAQFGTGRPDWFLPIPFLSQLYVDDGLLFDIRNEIRQQANVLMWEAITLGLLGKRHLI